MNTSQSGQSLTFPPVRHPRVSGDPVQPKENLDSRLRGNDELRSRRLPRAALGLVCNGRLAHPGAIVPGVAASLHPLLGDRTFTAHDRVKFLPVDYAKVVAALSLVPFETRIWNLEVEKIRLRHGDVDELLPQLVIGLALDPPAHRLR